MMPRQALMAATRIDASSESSMGLDVGYSLFGADQGEQAQAVHFGLARFPADVVDDRLASGVVAQLRHGHGEVFAVFAPFFLGSADEVLPAGFGARRGAAKRGQVAVARLPFCLFSAGDFVGRFGLLGHARVGVVGDLVEGEAAQGLGLLVEVLRHQSRVRCADDFVQHIQHALLCVFLAVALELLDDRGHHLGAHVDQLFGGILGACFGVRFEQALQLKLGAGFVGQLRPGLEALDTALFAFLFALVLVFIFVRVLFRFRSRRRILREGQRAGRHGPQAAHQGCAQ